ncbi:MAG: HD domain-containing protein [Steroidobacterales bacterium]
MNTIDAILSLFGRRGGGAYFGEAVTQVEHALQAAHFAAQEQASDELVLAALLHDIGHLVQDTPEDIADWHSDARHEVIGGAWLAKRFDPAVSDPVRLHVPAKRYLCAVDSGYIAKLSEASIVTLKLQGGPMSAAQIEHFEAEPLYREAVQVRRYDDLGKVAGLQTLGLDDYRPLILRLARS